MIQLTCTHTCARCVPANAHVHAPDGVHTACHIWPPAAPFRIRQGFLAHHQKMMTQQGGRVDGAKDWAGAMVLSVGASKAFPDIQLIGPENALGLAEHSDDLQPLGYLTQMAVDTDAPVLTTPEPRVAARARSVHSPPRSRSQPPTRSQPTHPPRRARPGACACPCPCPCACACAWRPPRC